jgi:hypothetical protein
MVDQKSVSGATQSVHIGDSAAGVAQVLGNDNTVTAIVRISVVPEDVLKALLAIQTTLNSHPATRALIDAAVQETKKPQPDKSAIGEQLKAALDIAKTGLGWAEIANKLAPFIATAANWVGGQWVGLLKP